MDVVLLGLPHKVSAHKVPEIMQTGRAHRRPVGRLPPARRRARTRRYYGADAPVAAAARRHVRLRPARAQPRADQDGAATSPRRAASPPPSSWRCCRSRKAGLLDGNVEVVGITGSSGAGVVPTATTHHPTRAVNLRTYKPLEHQHIPEITETLHAGRRARRSRCASCRSRRRCRAASSPPASRTSTARRTKEAIAAAFAETFRGEPFVRVPQKRLPEVAAVSRLELRRGRLRRRPTSSIPAPASALVTCFSATDNLIKGGAGQAIQSMNLMLGLDERLTLEDPGSWP